MKIFHFLIATVLIFFTTFLCLTGIHWGLPDDSIKKFSIPFKDISQEYIKKAWQISKEKQEEKLPRSVFNLVRSFHPDEQNILKSIAVMSPEKFDFNPHFFEYPSAQIYLVAITLKILSFFKVITLIPDIGYYFEHPHEMAKIYLVGRAVTVVMSVTGLIIFLILALWLCGNIGGLFATACLGLSPLYIINSHYMTVDIPMVFWVIVTVFFALVFMKKGKRYFFLLAAFFAGVACGTKYPAGIVIFILPFVYRYIFNDSKRKFFLYTLLSFLIFIAAFFITTPYSLFSFNEFKRDILYQVGCRGVSANVFVNLIKSSFDTIFALWIGTFLITPIFIFSVVFQIKRRNIADSLILTGFLLSMIPLLVMGGPKYTRYYLLVLPFLCLSAGCIFNEFFKLRKKIIGSLLVSLSIFLLAGVILKSTAYSMLMKERDVRIVAAEYIDNNIPQGANVVFTKDPWIFEVPTVNFSKYNVRIIPEENLFSAPSSSYLITGELQYFLTAGNRKDEMNKKILDFQRDGFILKYFFETSPRIGHWKFDQGWTIHDMIYIHPKIFVFYKP